MVFDPENRVVKLCAKGMEKEAQAKPGEASELFKQAWKVASDNAEKFTAAHYMARHQETIAKKLEWDLLALNLALEIEDEAIKGSYPSLYLNVAKGYEDLGENGKAKEHYKLALAFVEPLREDGYARFIKSGIKKGLKRLGVF